MCCFGLIRTGLSFELDPPRGGGAAKEKKERWMEYGLMFTESVAKEMRNEGQI